MKSETWNLEITFAKNILKQPEDNMQSISQNVLQQLDTHNQHLSPTYISIVILLRASGWRISDVLYLKLGNCLEQDGDKYWLVGDIMKTRVLGHKIPITKKVAAVVLAQMEWVKQHYTPEENPKQWLFPASKNWKKKTGSSSSNSKVLWVKRTTGSEGFKTFAFPHTPSVFRVGHNPC